MALTEASYSEDEVTTGSVNRRPPARTGRPRRSRSTLVTVSRAQVAPVILQYLVVFLRNMSNGAADQK